MIDLKMIQSPKGVLFPEEEFKKLMEERQRTLYALWQARTLRAECERVTLKCFAHNANWVKWEWVESKCRAKADELSNKG